MVTAFAEDGEVVRAAVLAVTGSVLVIKGDVEDPVVPWARTARAKASAEKENQADDRW